MKRLEIVDQGVLYRNPHPGHRAICAFLANVVPLGDDEILCFYRLGQAFYSYDGRLARLRSSDGGRSWNEEGLVWDPRNDPAPRTYTAPHATFTTLLMSTGLTFGTITSLYGLNAGIIDRTKFSLLIAVVVLSAIVPTAIAQRFFHPHLVPEEADV